MYFERNLVYFVKLKTRHVPGKANFISDCLSRWGLDPEY